MTAQVLFNRMDVTDRFPMLGLTIRTDGSPVRAEIAVGTHWELFRSDRKAQRTPTNFYSSRAASPLLVPRGEAIYVVPPEVLARFVGQDRLYVALATTPERTGATAEVAVMPTEGSPYVSLKGLTGRSMKRVRLLPSRQQRNAGYGANGNNALEWAGDAAAPGMEQVQTPKNPAMAPGPLPASNQGNGERSAPPPNPVTYDDGFGPMPPTTTPIAPVAGSPGVARGLEYPVAPVDPDAIGIRENEPVDAALAAAAQALRARALDAPLPDYPDAGRFVPAHANNFTPRRRSDVTVDRIVIHITAGGPRIEGTIAWFQNGNRVNDKGQPIRSSAHYIVGRDGEVVQMVRNAHSAHHATGANWRSIGIEHNANKPSHLNRQDLPPTAPQYEASARLVAWLCRQYTLPIDREHIVGHQEIAPGDNHDCPSSIWDWDHYMDLVRACASVADSQAQALAAPRRAWARAQDAQDALEIEITQLAGSSDIARYSWQDRGVAPAGYIKGMALVYARVYNKLKTGDAAALEMAKAKTADPDGDALTWYDDIFAAAGMSNDTAGVDTLRNLFVLLIGLGMRESSGRYCEGRDRSAQNTTAETAEAGLFQASFNARNASPLLPTLFAQYSANPSGFLERLPGGCSVLGL